MGLRGLRTLLPCLLSLLCCGAPAVGRAATPFPALYTVTVPGTVPQQAAQEALRVVLVRMTGTLDAATDTALAGIVSHAQSYVQLMRALPGNNSRVTFDGTALRQAVSGAGVPVWPAQRPVLLVMLPAQPHAASAQLMAELQSEAQLRGLPIRFSAAPAGSALSSGAAATPAGTAAPAASSAAAPAGPAAPAAGSASTGPAQALLQAAQSLGADAALLAATSGTPASGPGSTQLQWTFVAPGTAESWSSAPQDAIDRATDALVQSAQPVASQPPQSVTCQISGVTDLKAFTTALGALQSLPGVLGVTVQQVTSQALIVQLQARGGAPAVARAANGPLTALSDGSGGILQLQYRGGP